MTDKMSWRRKPTSRRRKLLAAMSVDVDVVYNKEGRLKECYHFFADFLESTPHPIAQVVLVVGWATAVACLNDPRILGARLYLDSSAGRALATIVAFLIVFRTNQSYNRWSEGRILWGKMNWSCVELSQMAAGWIDDTRLAHRIMHFAMAYAYTVKQYLRREPVDAEDLVGVIDAAEVARMNRLLPAVIPCYCMDVMRQCIKKGLTDAPQQYGVQAVARGLDMPVSQLAGQFADMARLRDTPQPDVFRVMLHMFTIVYLLLLPIISYETMGYWIIPEVCVTSYLMLGLQLAAEDLENPFGYDLSDLELDLYVANIWSQCRAAFYLGNKGDVDLTLSDGGAGREQAHSEASNFSGSTEPVDSSNNSYRNSLDAVVALAPVSQSDGSAATSEIGPPSQLAQGQRHRSIEVAKSESGELFAPQPPRSQSAERGGSLRSRDGNGETSRDQSVEQSGDESKSQVPPLKVLTIRHRTEEEVAPRRRSKPRPGRGLSPIVQESLFPSPQLPLQQYKFENKEAVVDADVV